jgi:hypothetical protein
MITAPDGRKFKITGPNKEGALAALQAQLAQQSQPQTPQGPDESLGGAAGYGVDNFQKMLGKGIQGVGELTGMEGVEQYGADVAQRNQAELDASTYQRPEGADGIVKNIREGDYTDAGRSLLYGAIEAAPQVGAGVAASVGAGLAATSAPVVGAGLAAAGTLAGSTMSLGATREEKEQQGLDPTATGTDLATAVASGLIELTPLKGGGATLKILREGVQEAGQEGLIIGGTAVQGGEYVAQDVVDRIGDAAAIGATVSGAANVGISTVSKTGERVLKPREELDPETDQAAGDTARMFQEIAETEGLNIKDVDPSSQKGANAVLNAARSKLREDIDANYKVLSKEVLKDADAATKAKFAETLRQARNKVSTTVTKENLDFVRDTVGNTQEGQALLNSLRKSNIVTEVYSGGLKGGISQFTDTFNPLPSFGRAYNPAGIIGGNINTGAALATGGQSLAVQIPTVIAGRGIDAITGRRSKLNTFIKKNKGRDGLADPTGPAVEGRTARLKAAQQAQVVKAKEDAAAQKKAEAAARAAAKQQAAEAKALAKQEEAAAQQRAKDEEAARRAATYVRLYKEGAPPKTNSPRGKMFAGVSEAYPKFAKDKMPTDIDAKVEEILQRIEARDIASETRRAIDEYRRMQKTGVMSSEGAPLTEVIGLVKLELLKDKAVDKAAAKTKSKRGKTTAPDGTPVKPRSPNVQDGIDSNKAFLKSLRDGMNGDKSISSGDRAVLTKALDDLGLNLGSDPVFKATEIVDGARVSLTSMTLVDNYLVPYLNRIKMQQAAVKAKASKAKPKAKKDDGPDQTPPTTPPQDNGPSGSGDTGGQSGQTGTGPVQLAQPPLVSPDPKPKKVKKPTTPAVKKNLPEAKAIIEIGKKGSKYENGIQDVDTALEVAKLLGITAQLMNSGTALQKATKQGKGTRGVHQWTPDMKGFGSSVFGIRPEGSFQGVKTTTLKSLHTLLHEMGHSLTQGNMDGKGRFGIGGVQNKGTGEYDKVGLNSYNYSVMKPILESKGLDHPAIKEIIAFQSAGKAYIESNPSETQVPRSSLTYLLDELNKAVQNNDAGTMVSFRNRLRNFRAYTNSTPELSVDPMWLYLMNPRLAKELMPINTKMIKAEFDKANNGKIKFYSHPFATILAVAMAMGLVAAAGGNDEEPPMPDGVLTA